MAINLRPKWTFVVLLAFVSTLVSGTTAALATWPSPPVWPTPLATSASSALDDETLERLVIFAFYPGDVPTLVPIGSLSDSLQALPGSSMALTLGYYECCYFFQPVPVSAVWSVEPADRVTIEPTTGFLTVKQDATAGLYSVHADVEHGRRVVSTELHVFTLEENPLVGYRTESSQIDCSSGAEFTPTERIQEFVIGADGTFSVTWFPFEVYKDYWGTYSFDPVTGEIDLVIANGNYIPSDFDGSGRYGFDGEGRLVLTEIWLGSPPNGNGPVSCGHIFD